jgi:type I restriction enzyme M protein
MPKTQEVTRELRPFNSLFNQMAYRHDASRIFEDLLTITICCFAHETQEELYFKTIKPYNPKELHTMAKLLGELITIYSNAEKTNSWVDPLGDFYEILAGTYKKSGLGQFFTPKSVCNLMAQITMVNSDWSSTVNDPCCGSGRLILATNQVVKDISYIAQDIDPICCKMTAVNMALHKIKGQVWLIDTIREHTPRKVYHINPNWANFKMPHILIST